MSNKNKPATQTAAVENASPVTEPPTVAAKKSGAGAMIYAGATLPGIPSGTVFTGKIPEKLNAPFICELVVPLSEYTTVVKRKTDPTTRAAFCYRKSAELAAELKK